MSVDPSAALLDWFQKFEAFPKGAHLLCPKVSDDDDEDYKSLDASLSYISIDEKQKRISEGEHRIETTFWNSLILGYSQDESGSWQAKFTENISASLKSCEVCVLNWHFHRQKYLQDFTAKFGEDPIDGFHDLLTNLDIGRIDKGLQWAKDAIDTIEASGKPFLKKHLGDSVVEVHLVIYEALCFPEYLRDAVRLELFSFVLSKLQGKKGMKLSAGTPLPGIAHFLFEFHGPERRQWAMMNWQYVVDGPVMTPAQFDWAIKGPLIKGIHWISSKDPTQLSAIELQEIECFWEASRELLKAMSGDLIRSHVSTLEVQEGDPKFYELLFRHMAFCRSEAILVACLRVLTTSLTRSPRAIWDFVGQAKPSVITDAVFNSPSYKTLLRQSLENCWTEDQNPTAAGPFPTLWVRPWFESLSLDQRYDACDQFIYTAFGNYASDPNLGEVGQAALFRAGFDVLRLTLQGFADHKDLVDSSGMIRLFANSTIRLASQHRASFSASIQPAQSTTSKDALRVKDSALGALQAALVLDMKLYEKEHAAIAKEKEIKDIAERNSKLLWESALDLYDRSHSQVELAKAFLPALEPVVGIEVIVPSKSAGILNRTQKEFNTAWEGTAAVLTKLLGRVSDLDDAIELSTLLEDVHIAQLTTALSLQGSTEVAEAACDILKSWTCQLSRSSAYEHMTTEHPLTTLGALVWYQQVILRKSSTSIPWTPMRPLVSMGRDVLRGLTDPSSGLLRQDKDINSKLNATIKQWWTVQWKYISLACRMIDPWSRFIKNEIMTEFCREVMEYAEALITEDGLITSTMARTLGQDDVAVMKVTLQAPKDSFQGLDGLIRLRDMYLVGVIVKVLVKILSRLRDNDLKIDDGRREYMLDAIVPNAQGRYVRATNLNDQQRAELLSALGLSEADVAVERDIEITKIQPKTATARTMDGKRQGRIDGWTKSGSSTPTSTSSNKPGSTNRDDVEALSTSLKNPLLQQLMHAKPKPKVKPLVADGRPKMSIKEQREREKAEKKARDAAAINHARALRGETNSGEGSGLQGLGVIGKDHGKSEIMVNSSDDDSDEDEESDTEDQLATITGGGQKTLTEAERKMRKAMMDKQRRPVKKERRQRSAKDMRARLRPSMDKLHDIVLAWNIFHNGENPPSGPASSQVDFKYDNATAYQRKFLPLLASETWRGLVTSKDETTSQPFSLKVITRATVDAFLEVTFSMPAAQYRDRDKGVREGDILVISEAEQPLANPRANNCLARVSRTKFKRDVFEITYRMTPRNNNIASASNPGNSFYAMKIGNLATIEREYAALVSLEYYDLCDEILKAEPSPVLRYGDERIAQGQSNWGLNRAQSLAVLGAQDNDGFTLIQGPPGTGKTKTIIAMVGNLLSEQLKSIDKGTAVPVRGSAQAQTPQVRQKKLLVCAPSNAAVDELVLRLKAGVKTSSGQTKKINVLRLGRAEAMNEAVKDVSLDELVRLKLEGDTTKEDAQVRKDQLHDKAGKLKELINELRPKREAARDAVNSPEFAELNRQFEKLKAEQREVGKLIDASKTGDNSVGREIEIKRQKVQQEILNSAQVLCATLSGSGHEMFSKLDVEFESVIIDEAAQCVELTALIPLKYGCLKCVMVGDPKQLPPTVLNRSAADYGYAQSLFVRMQQNHPKSVHLLDTQYRMHPEISAYPSREFYEDKLQDGASMAQLRTQPWHRTGILGPYRFFDVKGIQEKGFKGQSLVNTQEIQVALQMYERFSQDFGNKMDLTGKIGIITPYKGQLRALRSRFEQQYGEGITKFIEFNTTDAFQGRECEIIIFSCVRASSTGGIGFMKDIRRMNVGLTRAKSSLWVLGDSRALAQGEFWNKLIEDAKQRDRYTDGDILSLLRSPLKSSNAPLPEGSVADEDIRMTGVSPVESTVEQRVANMTSQPQERNGSVSDAMKSTSLGPPSIKVTDGHPENRKRPLEGDSSGPRVVKKVANTGPRGAMSKFGGGRPAAKPAVKTISRAPKDPSAEAALGITPPERSPSDSIEAKMAAAEAAGSGSDRQGHRPPPRPKGPPGPMRPKQKPNPMLRRR